MKELVNRFLNHKQARVAEGLLAQRTWNDYKTACDEIVAAIGKRRRLDDLDADDFAELREQIAKKYGPVRLGNTIQLVRCVFKFAYEAGMIDRPQRFGPAFERLSKKQLRMHRARQGPRLFAAAEVRSMIDAAGVQMKAMLLLAIDGGLGNSDCGNLPIAALDLKAGWIDFPRPKTGIARKVPLWPETVQALRDALVGRPEPKNEEDAGLVFITKYGLPWRRAPRTTPLPRRRGNSSIAWASADAATSTACGIRSGPSRMARRTSRPPTTSWGMKWRT